MDHSRRAFVRFTVTFAGAAALSACGTSAPPGGSGGGGGSTTTGGGGGATGGGAGESTCATNGARAISITENHGHSLLVPAADFTDGADRTYDIHGAATHSHFVTLTLAQRSTLRSGTQVTVVSTTSEFHNHDVTIACA